jgi:DNA-binding LytR/AlgR family response regulator
MDDHDRGAGMNALRIMIVEDEAVIARRVARLTSEILGPQAGEIVVAADVADARRRIDAAAFDLLLLDLNLSGGDGFDLLRDATSRAFDTIVISAHTTRAIQAFEYGVRDFVPKPFSRDRLALALNRLLSPAPRAERSAEFLGIRANGGIEFVPLNRIVYIRGCGARSKIVLKSGATMMHDRMLDRIESILPPHFERIHKSIIVDTNRIKRLVAHEGSRYSVMLHDGTTLPVGRTKVAALRERIR